MTNVTISMVDGQGRVILNCGLILDHVAELKSKIVKAFEKADQVTLILNAATEVDVAGLQLLCASHRFAVGRGKQLQLTGASERLYEVARSTGFFRGEACAAGHADPFCMWSNLSEQPQ